jgi:hypothetical protein
MTCIVTDIKQNNINSNNISYFPNPFKDNVTFNFNKNLTGKIYMYTIDGKLIFEDILNGESFELTSEKLNEKTNGMLFVRIVSETETSTFKLIRSN